MAMVTYILVPFTTGQIGQNMYTLKVTPILNPHVLVTINYKTVHCHLGHSSKEVAKCAKWHITGLLDFTILDFNETTCPGCAKGKQPQ